MTTKEINIAVAELCGWKDIEIIADQPLIGKHDDNDKYPHTVPYQGHNADNTRRSDYGASIPDYANDLNAMHDAEARIVEDSYTYDIELQDLYEGKLSLNTADIWHCSAEQRALAFIGAFEEYTYTDDIATQ